MIIPDGVLESIGWIIAGILTVGMLVFYAGLLLGLFFVCLIEQGLNFFKYMIIHWLY